MQEFLNGKGLLAKRQEVAEEFNYDWHARKLNIEQPLRGLVLMQVTAYRSTRDHQYAAENDVLFHAKGAGVAISVSGLAQANRNRPIEPFLARMQAVMTAVENLPARKLRVLDKQTWKGIVGLLHRTEWFDATTLKLPPKLSKWAPGKHEGTAGIKMQLCIDGERGDFKRSLLTPEPGNDSPYFEAMLGDLAEQEGRIYLFDAGYWKIDTYHDIAKSGNDFVTKRAGKNKPHLVQELPIPPADQLSSGYEVLQDALVHLGDHQDRLFRMLRVRQTLELAHLTSHDPIGILRQSLTALIVWGLLVIANQDSGKLSPKQLWRQLRADIHQAVFEYGHCLGFQGAMGLLSK